ncbi:MAG: zinc ribbon domain-containing protein [Muribaculaceae bacterium]|nr:zinc ribbon domain-containing protein [Muribaculaceae bacterium]
MKTCVHCGAPLDDDARFCTACGCRVERTCVHCDAPVDADAKFCTACGEKLDAVESEASAEAPVEANDSEAETWVDDEDDAQPNPVFAWLRSYWPCVAGAATLLVAGACWLILADKKFDNRPFNQVFPPVKKVVEVTSRAPLYIGEWRSSTIAGGANNRTYCNEHVDTIWEGTLLSVIDDHGDRYRVEWGSRRDMQVTIAKSDCRVIEAGGIDKNVVHTILDSTNKDRYGAWRNICHRTDGNRLVVMEETTYIQTIINSLYLGVWKDGMYIFYYKLQLDSLTYDATAAGLQMSWDEETQLPSGVYGPDVSRYEPGYEEPIMDWCRVSEEQLADIFHEKIVAADYEMLIYQAKDLKWEVEGNPYDDTPDNEDLAADNSGDQATDASDYEFGELSGATCYQPFGDIELCLPSEMRARISNEELPEASLDFYSIHGDMWSFRPNDVIYAGGEEIELTYAWKLFHYLNLRAVRDEGMKKVYKEFHTAGRLDAAAHNEYYSEIAECASDSDMDKYCLIHAHWLRGNMYGAIVTGPSRMQLQQVQDALKHSQ